MEPAERSAERSKIQALNGIHDELKKLNKGLDRIGKSLEKLAVNTKPSATTIITSPQETID